MKKIFLIYIFIGVLLAFLLVKNFFPPSYCDYDHSYFIKTDAKNEESFLVSMQNFNLLSNCSYSSKTKYYPQLPSQNLLNNASYYEIHILCDNNERILYAAEKENNYYLFFLKTGGCNKPYIHIYDTFPEYFINNTFYWLHEPAKDY